VVNRRRLAAALASLALGFGTAPAAHAWGAAGHRVVGAVAEQLLDERSRRALAELTDGEPLAELGLALDRDRRALAVEYPGSARWHYDNHPACDEAAALPSYCADGNCASRAYAKYLARLADRRTPRAERRFALEVVVHVLADVHQPLHVADHDDRGANEVRVRVGERRRTESLHAAWDVDFVRRAAAGAGVGEFARALIAEYAPERAALAAGDFAAWTRESYALARTEVYGRLPGFACGAGAAGVLRLPDDYIERATGIVREQLARAGFRLARVLEAAL
jgi:nuclease S1